ncbi:MAG: penicillin-binding transpeptidase domain-containing protein, partial [Angelakisella sp.]
MPSAWHWAKRRQRFPTHVPKTAAALESGFSTDYSYVCPGYYQLGEHRYHCHQRAGHWELSMPRALEQSCNPYFINLGERLGGEKLCAMAAKMGFGTAFTLADGIVSASGNLPDPAKMNDGELANISFGQGSLLATPLQIAHMTAVIAGGGASPMPTLYGGTTADGSVIVRDTPAESKRIISKSSAEALCHLMVRVVENGSGKKAACGYGGTGGKTSS